MSVLVGTSGFDYRDWRGPVYPRFLKSSDRLAFYARYFETVELNVTFYRMPKAEAFRGWREAVPEGFRFAVKASRYLTHIRRLRDPQGPVEYLMERASILEDRLGPVLLQLPPDMRVELERLERTLEAFGGKVRLVVEPRHASWFTPELVELLGRYDAALCMADRIGPLTPLWPTAGWSYLRLHEGRARPRPCYGRTALRSWLERMRIWPQPADGYVYFNNDPRACAVRNALTYQRMIRRAAAALAAAGRSMGSSEGSSAMPPSAR
ncbi:MAG: DUF72 domain-containing protein [Chloroflexi bacterium]|nr:DUF72 domain-containing protein [Chloroflexota bacterium]